MAPKQRLVKSRRDCLFDFKAACFCGCSVLIPSNSSSSPSSPIGLLLDLVLVGIVKAVVRRRRPAHNRMDMFATFSVDRFSFPSGHATRAAMCGRFLLVHLVLAAPLRVLVVLWVLLVGLSRVLLGRHHVTDVLFGFWMGYFQYNIVEMMWLSTETLQELLGQTVLN